MPISPTNQYVTQTYPNQGAYVLGVEEMYQSGWILVCFVVNNVGEYVATFRQKLLLNF